MTGSLPAAVDVVVVGGGPAGSATAIWCARRGLRVVVVERMRFPRHRPGETLAPGIEPLFQQLGVADAVERADFARHPGTWVTWSGPRRFDAFGADVNGPWLGFQAPRDRLDHILLDGAAEAGVMVCQPSRATSPVVENGRVVGVVTGGRQITAAWVVDASGGQHWLARHLGMPRRFASPRLIARYGYLRGSSFASDGVPEIVADETGWTWTARIAPGLHHWTRLSFTDDDPRRNRPPPRFEVLTMRDRPRGADVSWRIVERPAGPGYVCVGDAAAVLDPASSHGVLKALMSGMMAGHVIAENISGSATPHAATGAYINWLTNHFTADVSALIEMYRSLPDPRMWVRDHDASSFHLVQPPEGRAGSRHVQDPEYLAGAASQDVR